MDPVTFQLKDADDNLHDYEVTPHKTSEGTELVLQILALAAEPLGRLAAAAMQSKDNISGDDDIMDVLAGLDLSQVGSDLKAALLALDSDSVQKFFAHTVRDGEPLHKFVAYNDAYQANWMEWMQAVKAIVQANGFLPFFHMLASK